MTATERYQKKLDLYREGLRLERARPAVQVVAGIRLNEQFDVGKVAVTILLGRGYHALVDLADLGLVSRYRWRAKVDENSRNIYAHAHGHRGPSILLHRLLLDAKPGQIVDHASGDSLDNRRSNLRLCSNSQNIRNSRTYSRKTTATLKGVCLQPNGQFRAQIMCSRRKINLGQFTDEESAGRAYDTAARKLFGDFARCNFPEVAA